MSKVAHLRGAFWQQDTWGRITNAAVTRDRIARPVSEAAEEVVDLAHERFGDRLHSVYLSGPAARGRPGGSVFYILLRAGGSRAHSAGDTDWERAAAAQVRRRNPGAGRIVLSVTGCKDVFTAQDQFSAIRFRLAVNSICIAGRNMIRMLPPQKLDAAAANGDILYFRNRMLAVSQRVAAARAPDRVQAAASDAGKIILAAAYALVMEREQIYTEDLDMKRDLFVLSYPARARDINMAYEMAIRPSAEALEVMAYFERVTRWLSPMADAWLDRNNPQRAERLKV
jgi:hypothetical protein